MKDRIATQFLDYMEMAQARDFTQCVRLSAVLWNGLGDEHAVRIAIDGEGYTVVDVMTLFLTHGTHTHFL